MERRGNTLYISFKTINVVMESITENWFVTIVLMPVIIMNIFWLTNFFNVYLAMVLLVIVTCGLIKLTVFAIKFVEAWINGCDLEIQLKVIKGNLYLVKH